MPFTIGGDYIPNEPSKKTKKPVLVKVVKRKNSFITVIYHASTNTEELKKIASNLKTKLGCGGSVKNDTIEIQGDKKDQVRKYLQEQGIK